MGNWEVRAGLVRWLRNLEIRGRKWADDCFQGLWFSGAKHPSRRVAQGDLAANKKLLKRSHRVRPASRVGHGLALPASGAGNLPHPRPAAQGKVGATPGARLARSVRLSHPPVRLAICSD